MDMEALNLLEKRIDNLSRMLGPLPDDLDGSEDLTDTVLSANTLINSSMENRENIVQLFSRANELERYLDPAFLEETQELKAKEVYVNTVAPELAASFEMLEKIKNLEPALGAEYFRNIPDVSEKLKEMTISASELGQRNDLVEESLLLAMQRYCEIQTGITESLRVMNERLEKLDKKLTKKRDEDI